MKILRIGIIQSGTIVEERLLRKHAHVTVGQEAKNTFVVPSPGFTGRERIFTFKNGRYFLSFDEDMSGRINVRNEVRDLKEVREGEGAKLKGGRWYLALDEGSRGKVVVGSVTVLFQFVTPPAHDVSRPQLPRTVRSGFLTDLDMALVGMIALSLVVQLSTAVGLHYSWETEWQYKAELQRGDVRHLLRMEIAEAEEKDKEPEKTDEDDKKKDEEKEKEDVVVDPIVKPEEKKKSIEEIREKKKKDREKVNTPKKLTLTERRNKVRTSSALRFVTAEGPGGTLADTLEKGVTARDMAAFDGLGVHEAVNADEGRYVGTVEKDETDLSYRRVSSDELGGPKAGNVEGTADKVEKKIEGNVFLSKKMKTKGGRLNKDGVAAAIKRRKSSIRRCYEEALRSNEGAGGKLMVEFTVGLRGRVTSSRVVKDSTGSSHIAKCLLRRLESWRFPKPEDGSPVTVRYPFVFSKKN